MRVIGIMLAMILLFNPVLISHCASADVVYDSKEEIGFALLEQIGVLKPYSDGSLRQDELVSRAALAVLAVRLLNIPEPVGADGVRFTDISDQFWAAGAINTVAALGLMNGFEDGTFRPDETVTQIQALKVLVSLLGYDKHARQSGGFPNGYLSMGASLKLLRGINFVADATLTRGVMVRMILNALEADITSYSGCFTNFEHIKYEILKGENLLSSFHGIERARGRVTATPDTRLSSNGGLAPHMLEIERRVYNAGKYQDKGLLGKYVEVYYKEIDMELEIVFLYEMGNRNIQLTIDFNQINRVSGDILFYNDHHDKEQRAYLTKEADYIYNGMAIIDFSLESLRDKDGELRLLDADGDYRYETVFIYVYYNVIVDSFNPEFGLIAGKNGDTCIDIKDGSTVVRFYKNEILLDKVDLSTGDVVSVFESVNDGRRLLELRCGRGTVSGKITEIREDKVYINGNAYAVSQSVDIESFSVGEQGRFYLDYLGKIAGSDRLEISGEQFMYLIRVAPKKGVDPGFEMKMLTREGIKIYSVSIPFDLNNQNTSVDNAYIALVALCNKARGDRVVKANVNSKGEISGIITVDYMDDTLPYAARRYRKSGETFGEFFINMDTVVFYDKDVDTLPDEERYSVVTKLALTDNLRYDIQAYGIGTDYSAQAVYVAQESPKPISVDTAVTLVTKISKIEYQGEVRWLLRGMQGGSQIEYITVSGLDLSGIKKGDVVLYSLDINNQINDVELELSASPDANFRVNDRVRGSGNRPGNFDSQFRTVYGILSSKSGNRIAVRVGTDENSPKYIFDILNFKVYMCDMNRGTIWKATTDDVAQVLESNNPYSRIFVYTRYGDARDIILYKFN